MALSWYLELSVYPRIWEPLVIDCGCLRLATLCTPAVAWQGAQERVWSFPCPSQHLLLGSVSRLDRRRIVSEGLLVCELLRSE